MDTNGAPPGFCWVYCKYFHHWRTKKPVYRKDGGYFRFLVPMKRKR